MYSITIMCDQRASRRLGESGSSWIIGDSLDVSPRTAMRLPAAVIGHRCVRRGNAWQAVECGERHPPRVSTAFDPAKCNSAQIAAGDISDTGSVALSMSHDTSVEQSPWRCSGYSGREDPWVRFGAYELASSSCPHESSSPLEFEAPKLRGTGSAGFGISSQSREACPAIRRDKCG